jgi:hypothetical protein
LLRIFCIYMCIYGLSVTDGCAMPSDCQEAPCTRGKRPAEDAFESPKRLRCDIEEVLFASEATPLALTLHCRAALVFPESPEVLFTPQKRLAETASSKSPYDDTSRRQHVQQTPERYHWDALKRLMIEAGAGSKNPPESPTVRIIYGQVDMGAFFLPPIVWSGKTVFQSDRLFDSDALVLKEDKTWETNRERMERGCAPVGYKGISKCAGRLDLSKEEIAQIRNDQRLYRIELQHVTQKDTGLAEDPICEMTHDAHMGEDTRHIVDHPEEGGVKILLSSAKKVDADNWLAANPHPGREIIANILHFRQGDSLINRSDFNTWKKSYWQERARELKEKAAKESHFL